MSLTVFTQVEGVSKRPRTPRLAFSTISTVATTITSTVSMTTSTRLVLSPFLNQCVKTTPNNRPNAPIGIMYLITVIHFKVFRNLSSITWPAGIYGMYSTSKVKAKPATMQAIQMMSNTFFFLLTVSSIPYLRKLRLTPSQAQQAYSSVSRLNPDNRPGSYLCSKAAAIRCIPG